MIEPNIHQLDENDVSGPSGPSQTSQPNKVHQILPDLCQRYTEAFRANARGEEIWFDLTFTPMPTGQYGPPDPATGERSGQLLAMLVLYAEIRGAAVMSKISGTRLMELGGQDDAAIDLHTREMIDGMIEARSEQLDQMKRDAVAATQRGEQPSGRGFIQPNGMANPTWNDAERAFRDFAGGE